MSSSSLLSMPESKGVSQGSDVSAPKLPKFDWESSSPSILLSTSIQNVHRDEQNAESADNEVPQPVSSSNYHPPAGLPLEAPCSESPRGVQTVQGVATLTSGDVKDTARRDERTCQSQDQTFFDVLGGYKATGSWQSLFEQVENVNPEPQPPKAEPCTPSPKAGESTGEETPASPPPSSHGPARADIPFERTASEPAPPPDIATVIARTDSPFTTDKPNPDAPTATAVPSADLDLQPDIITVTPLTTSPTVASGEYYGPSRADIEDLLARTASWRDAQDRPSSPAAFARWNSLKSFTSGVVRTLSKRDEATRQGSELEREGSRRWTEKVRAGSERLDPRAVLRRRMGREGRRVYGGRRMVISDETLLSRRGRAVGGGEEEGRKMESVGGGGGV